MRKILKENFDDRRNSHIYCNLGRLIFIRTGSPRGSQLAEIRFVQASALIVSQKP